MKLIHLTDAHFVPPGQTLYGGDPRKVLEAAVAEINRHHADAELLCITGDLAHWGEDEALASLADVLSRLTPPVELLIGNHDDREAFARHFPGQRRDENGFVQSMRRSPQGRLLFLDTTMPGDHCGIYCAARRSWLARQLQDAEDADEAVFLFMHHPPFATGMACLDLFPLREPEAFATTIAPYARRIRHIFFGHIHRPLCGNWRGISFSSLRGMNHQCWLAFDVADTIIGSFEPPSYAVVLIDEASVIAHTHDFLDGSEKFDLRHSPVGDWALKHAHP